MTTENLEIPDTRHKDLCAQWTQCYELTFYVSRNHCKLLIVPRSGPQFQESLTFCLSKAFDFREESQMKQIGLTYSVEGYGRCWSIHPDRAEVEFWYPEKKIDDIQINQLIDGIQRSLFFIPIVEEADFISFKSIRELHSRNYRLALKIPILVSIEQVDLSVTSFLNYSKEIIESFDAQPNDTVSYEMASPLRPSIYETRFTIFCRSPATIQATTSTSPQAFSPHMRSGSEG